MSEFTPEEVEALRLSLACEPRVVESATVLALISSYQRLMADTLALGDKLSRAVVVEGTETPIVLERQEFKSDVDEIVNTFAKALLASAREDYPFHLARLKGALYGLAEAAQEQKGGV